MACTCDLASFHLPEEPLRQPCAQFETDHRFSPFCMRCNHAKKCHCDKTVNSSSVTGAFQIANTTEDQRA